MKNGCVAVFGSFLVGASFFREKARLLHWLVFFLFFFRQTTDLIAYVPLLTDFTRSGVLVSTRFTVNPAVRASSPCFSQKIFSSNFIRHCATLSFFSALCDFFLDFLPSKCPTFEFFSDILQQTKVPKSPIGIPFYVFRHYETVQSSHFSFFLKK